MRYLIEPRDVQGYRFLSFAKNMGKHLSNNMVKKILIVLKNCFKKAI